MPKNVNYVSKNKFLKKYNVAYSGFFGESIANMFDDIYIIKCMIDLEVLYMEYTVS